MPFDRLRAAIKHVCGQKNKKPDTPHKNKGLRSFFARLTSRVKENRRRLTRDFYHKSLRQERRSAGLHPYAVWERLYRFAPLLIIPVAQQLLAARPTGLWQRIWDLREEVLVAAGLIAWAIVSVRVTRWHAGGNIFYLRRGLLFRQRKEIPFDRVDALLAQRAVFSGLFGAAHVSLDTPAGHQRRTDISLTLFYSKLRHVMDGLFDRSKQHVVYRAGTRNILLMAASWSNPATGLLILAPFVQQAGRILGEEIPARLYDTLGTAAAQASAQTAALGIPPIAAAAAYILAAGWAVALLVQTFRYSDFSLSRSGSLALVQRGLISRNFRLIRLDRVGAVSLRQTLLMRLFGLYSGYVHCVGSGKEKGDRSLLTAACRLSRQQRLIGCLTALPVTHADEVLRPPRWAKWSFLWPPLTCCGVLSLLVLFGSLWGGFGRLAALVALLGLIPSLWWLSVRRLQFWNTGVSLPHASSRHKAAVVVSGGKRLTMWTVSIPIARIQQVSLRQNPLQRRRGTCNVRVFWYAESREHFTVRQIPIDKAQKFFSFLEYPQKAHLPNDID